VREDVFVTQVFLQCGNLSLTNCVGYDVLLFHERYITWSILKESVLHNRNVFTFLTDLVYFTTCFGQLGYLQVIQTMYEILTRKLLAY